MLKIVLSETDVMKRFSRQLRDMADTAPKELAEALNRAGLAIRRRTVTAEARQTGLSSKIVERAQKVRLARPSRLAFEIEAAGGDIALKYFKPTETAQGVSAAPLAVRAVTAGTFMRAGWWPHRVDKPGWHGQVFRRTGAKTASGKDQFEKVRSGVYVADELVRGATKRAFDLGSGEALVQIVGRVARLLP